MTLNTYISAIKAYLETVGNDPLPVVDGPVDFALNTQGQKSFICVSETTIGYEIYTNPRTAGLPIGIEIHIYVEKAAYDGINQHLIRARNMFDTVWQSLGGFEVTNFQLMRVDGERLSSDDPSAVDFVIRCNLEVTEYETCA